MSEVRSAVTERRDSGARKMNTKVEQLQKAAGWLDDVRETAGEAGEAIRESAGDAWDRFNEWAEAHPKAAMTVMGALAGAGGGGLIGGTAGGDMSSLGKGALLGGAVGGGAGYAAGEPLEQLRNYNKHLTRAGIGLGAGAAGIYGAKKAWGPVMERLRGIFGSKTSQQPVRLLTAAQRLLPR